MLKIIDYTDENDIVEYDLKLNKGNLLDFNLELLIDSIYEFDVGTNSSNNIKDIRYSNSRNICTITFNDNQKVKFEISEYLKVSMTIINNDKIMETKTKIKNVMLTCDIKVVLDDK